MKIYVKSIVVIVCICLVMGLLLAGVYQLTAPVIAANEEAAKQKALDEMFAGSTFALLETPDAPKSITAVYAVNGGSAYVAYLRVVTGYTNGETTLALGYDAATGTITELRFLTYNESVDCGPEFPASFAGQTGALTDVNTTASPAIYTRAAVKSAVEEACGYLAGLH